MQGVEFDINNNGASMVPSPSKKSFSPFVSFLKRFGIEDPAVANIILVCFSALLFGVAIFIYAGGNNTTKLTPEEVATQLRALSEMQNIKR